MPLKVNEYFEGNVKSIGFEGERGRVTVGVMNPGAYQFSTSTVELMTVIDGALAVELPGRTGASVYRAGDSFEVGARTTFRVTATVPTAYHCLYRP